jgi:D-alanyl-D-alanine carboxypeptidase
MRKAVRVSLLFAMFLPAVSSMQEQVISGPPPEIRNLIESFIKAVNAEGPDAFESMAKAHFAPGYLAKQTREERARLAAQIRKQFGTVTRDRVVRDGPDEPLQMHVRGSTGATGVITLILDPAAPFKISDVRVDAASARPPGGRGGDRSIPAPVDPSMSPEVMGRALDAHLSRLAADDTFAGALLVARDGRRIFEKAYGFADRANRRPNTVDTRYNLGSINKKFTELAVGQLAAAGKLSREDTIGRFFPDYPQATSRAATIAQLLRHTGGIADFFGDEFSRTSKDRFRSNADYFALVSRLPPTFAPGARNQYCNGCYITLGAIIERVSGMPYERYVAERIFAPAGMSHTGYPQSDAIEADVAVGYSRQLGGEGLRSNVFAHGAAGSAAGGGYSTVGDLLAFANALRSGTLTGADASALGIAGGAPGINALLEADDTWTVAVLTNLDPPSASAVGMGIMSALGRNKG